MAWIATHKDPRYHQLQGGDIFTFNSGNPAEDFLRGYWLKMDGPHIDSPSIGVELKETNAVRLSDGAQHIFQQGDHVEYCYMKLNV